MPNQQKGETAASTHPGNLARVRRNPGDPKARIVGDPHSIHLGNIELVRNTV